MKKIILILMILPIIGLSQNKYQWKETKFEDEILILKSTQEPVTGIVEGKELGNLINWMSNYHTHTAVYDNGKKMSCVGYYKNGQIKHTVEKDYLITYFKNGNKEAEGYANLFGYGDGEFKTYYKNGQLKTEGNYKDGKKDGLEKYYYENGQLEAEMNWSPSLRNENYSWQTGSFKEYYENGKLKEQGNFTREGIKTGRWTKYLEDGTIKKEKEYK